MEVAQGAAVALSADGNTLAVGGLGFSIGGLGATWVFIRNGAGVSATWSQQSGPLQATDASFSDQGSSVALSGDGNTLAVGGPLQDSAVGAAWLYRRVNGNWSQYGLKIQGAGAIGTSLQGSAISLSSDASVMAVYGSADNSNIGAVWVFH